MADKKVAFAFGRYPQNPYLCTALTKSKCGNSSVGRARPCQGRGREFESRLPLKSRSLIYFRNAQVAELVDAHVSGACAARCAGSSPVLGTSLERWRNW